MKHLIRISIAAFLMLSLLSSGCKKDNDSTPTGNDPDPQITGISPQSGPVGANVTVSGTDFSSAPSDLTVSFNGTESQVLSSSLTSIQTIVPEGATTGVVSVTVRGTTINGPSFTVEQPAPQISSVSPDTAYVGQQIEIRGVNFGDEVSATVLISNIEPTILEYSDSLIIAEAVDPEGDTGSVEVSVAVENSVATFDEFYILRIQAVATGEFHSCAITLEGNIYCWGDNEFGQLGDNSFTDSTYPVAVDAPDGVKFSSITASRYHTLAIDESGQVWGWGNNSAGKLGDGTTTDQNVPVQAALPQGIIIDKISTGIAHTLALDESGQAWAWGLNSSGRLGDGTETNSLTPIMVSQPPNNVFTDLDAGLGHSLALDSDGQVWAWGNNNDGTLGDGTTINRLEPTLIAMPTGVEFSKVSGGADHSLALSTTGDVWTWGSNGESQLGSGNLNSSSIPVQANFPNSIRVTDITAGHFHNLAITTNGELWGWGSSSSGRLGSGFVTASVSEPTLLEAPSETGFYLITANRNHSLAVSTNGSIPYAWGRNDDGQLGAETSQPQRSRIERVIFNRE